MSGHSERYAVDFRHGHEGFGVYRTMYNSEIRSIDLKAIDFARVKYRSVAIDDVKEQPIVPIILN